MKTTRLLLAIPFIITALSCVPLREATVTSIAPGLSFPADEVNTRLKLTPIPGLTEEKPLGVLNFDLINSSHGPVGFPADFGVRVFFQRQGQWVQVPNDYHYASATNVIVPQETDPMGDAVVPIYPALGPIEQPVKIRVVVVGMVYENNQPTPKSTAAYVDWVIQP